MHLHMIAANAVQHVKNRMQLFQNATLRVFEEMLCRPVRK